MKEVINNEKNSRFILASILRLIGIGAVIH
jgi:hypothetical protein